MRYIFISTLAWTFMFVMSFNHVFAQNNTLKTYSGEFVMQGFGTIGGSAKAKVEGNAIYHYRNAPDGTRIFEGSFSFSDGKGRTVQGEFKNDKQVGRWVWKRETASTNDNSRCIIVFDDNGRVNDFNIWEGGNMNDNEQLIQKQYWVQASCSAGDVCYVMYHDNVVEMNGSVSVYGRPTGYWNLAGKRIPTGKCKLFYDYHGTRGDGYYIDETTGDKKPFSSDYPNFILTYKVKGEIMARVFRSTPGLNDK